MDILYSADELLTPALDKLYELRPSTLPFVNYRTGTYWHPFQIFRGQAVSGIRHLKDLVVANNLFTATGDDLRDYVASEFNVLPDTTDTFALGELTLTRVNTSTQGVIPAGTRFSRAPNQTTQIPLLAATYETETNAAFAIGQSTLGPIPIRAIRPGADANHPLRTDSIPHGVTAISPLFDNTITVASFSASGGAGRGDDAFLVRYAQAFAKGEYGPTIDATVYGALKSTGVRNLIAFDYPGGGYQKVIVADPSWASSDRWAASVAQQIYDADLVGVGCKVVVGKVRNQLITVTATVKLRDVNYLRETTIIDQAIQKACKSYFDDRPDWNVWKSRGLRAAITRAHPKILYCSTVTVSDLTGATVPEIATVDLTAEQLHYYLVSSAVKVAYQGPT